MAQYRVKPGERAFLGGAIRTEGYVHQVDKAYPKDPSWGDRVTGAVASANAEPAGNARSEAAKKAAATRAANAAKKAEQDAAAAAKAGVSFTDENVVNNTVQL